MDRLLALGNRIREIRESKKISQAELASLINKDQQSIQRLEKGKVNPGFQFLLDIADGLNIEVAELFQIKTISEIEIIQIVIIDDHPAVREGVKTILEEVKNYKVIGGG